MDNITQQYEIATFRNTRHTRIQRRFMSMNNLISWLAMERYHRASQEEYDRGHHYIDQYMLEVWEDSLQLPDVGDQWGLKGMCDKVLLAHRDKLKTTEGKKYIWNAMHKKHRSIFKMSLTAWSPTIYKPGVVSRSNAGVRALCAVVLDYDRPDIEWGEVIPMWAELNWAMVAHTTISHCNLHGHRFRVIIPLATPCPAEVWPRLWQYFYRLSGGLIDKQACDLSRIFYLNWTPLSESESQVFVQRTAPLDWQQLVLPEPKVKATPIARPTPRRLTVVKDDTLNTSAQARAQLGASLNGYNNGKTISKVVCPSCGRRSFWWWIEPSGMLKAKCNHANSCGHTAWLDQLGGIR